MIPKLRRTRGQGKAKDTGSPPTRGRRWQGQGGASRRRLLRNQV